MKALKGISMFALAAAMLVSCKQNSNKQDETVNPTDSLTTEQVSSTEISGEMQKATFQIEGMSCAVGCAKVIEKKLAKLDGVKAAAVDFESKTATIEYDDAKQNPEEITKVVEEIAKGAYKVENMTVAKDLAMLDQDDKPTADKKSCCSKDKDGKKSCSDKKAHEKDKKGGCCSKDKKETTTKLNVI
ncbi:MAG TPA: heavy metal-associated domain-containing protein [Flavobacterium sp.]|nr:heavy metal-associated domain-containing protein [Flavobacterium sp.]